MQLRMDWRTVRFDWNRARAFLVTAEEGSLSAAGRALGMAQPTVGRQIDALERELDLLLFDRVGRRLVLTEAGMDLLEHVRSMGEAASRMSLAASGQSQTLAGPVSISASQMFAARVLPPIVAELRREQPGIHVEVVASDTASDLRRREADIAVRNFRPTHPDLVAKKVKDMGGHFYATTEYLERIGRPQGLDDLEGVEFIGYDRTDTMLDMLCGFGLELTQADFPLVSESQLVQWELMKQGLGLAVNAEPIGDAEPGVERALPAMKAIMFPIWVVSHRELHTSRRVRMVFDLLVERLGRV
jgi:DNA-binding transcriptional LysR family regulator